MPSASHSEMHACGIKRRFKEAGLQQRWMMTHRSAAAERMFQLRTSQVLGLRCRAAGMIACPSAWASLHILAHECQWNANGFIQVQAECIRCNCTLLPCRMCHAAKLNSTRRYPLGSGLSGGQLDGARNVGEGTFVSRMSLHRGTVHAPGFCSCISL